MKTVSKMASPWATDVLQRSFTSPMKTILHVLILTVIVLLDSHDALAGGLCELTLGQTDYFNREVVTFDVFRIANTGSLSQPVELKVWLKTPGQPPIALLNVGGDGSVVLPVSFDENFGPVDLFIVTSGFTRGVYEVGCRLLEPITSELLAEDLNSFALR
jgi:hypothetical protein